MGKLEITQLEEYCKAVLQFEVSQYVLSQARDSIHELLKKSKPHKPVLKLPAMPPVSMSKRPVEPAHPTLLVFKSQIFIVILIISAALTIVTLTSIFEHDEMLILAILFLFIDLFTISFLIFIPISNKKHYDKAVHEYDEKYDVFKKELEEYDSTYAKKRISAERDYQKKCSKLKELHEQETGNYEAQFRVFQSLEKEAEQLSLTYTETTRQLQILYDQNIIFTKYRNLIAMAAITEYIESGRCNRLEGMGGAYNLFEEEIRLNLIITQLSKVVECLDQIRTSQYLLYSELSAANAHLSRIANDVQNTLNEVKSIKADSEIILKFSAITAYCSHITAENSALISSLAIADYIAD